MTTLYRGTTAFHVPDDFLKVVAIAAQGLLNRGGAKPPSKRAWKCMTIYFADKTWSLFISAPRFLGMRTRSFDFVFLKGAWIRWGGGGEEEDLTQKEIEGEVARFFSPTFPVQHVTDAALEAAIRAVQQGRLKWAELLGARVVRD